MDTAGDRSPTFEDRFAVLAALSYRVAYRLVGHRAEAEDLAQEALARAYTSWRRIGGHDEAWVSRVTTNLAIGRWRRSRRIAMESRADCGDDVRLASHDGDRLRAGAGAPDPVDRLDLVAALRRLPRRQREVVTLRYLADLPELEVAAALGCATGTVKQHAHRGLAALRRHLHDDEDDRTPRSTAGEEESRVRPSR